MFSDRKVNLVGALRGHVSKILNSFQKQQQQLKQKIKE